MSTATYKTTDFVRTNSFRLCPEHFGKVHVYRPGKDFVAAWYRLEQLRRGLGGSSRERRLPYKSLATALRVLSGSFVLFERQVVQQRALIVANRLLNRELLKAALTAWELRALESKRLELAPLAEDLHREEIELLDLVCFRDGRPPTFDGGNWVWDAVTWAVAERFAEQPFQTTDECVQFRFDCEAGLVSWDRVVRREGRDSGAMHKIELRAITVPGVSEPVVAFKPTFVRLVPTWKVSGGVRHAWADLGSGQPLLWAEARNERYQGGWRTVWQDNTAEVLKYASIDGLPDLDAGPTIDGALRAPYAEQPNNHPLGTGVGIVFHEQVACHMRRVLETAEPIDLGVTARKFKPKHRVIPRPPLSTFEAREQGRLHVFVIYASAEIRRRAAEGLLRVLRDDACIPDGEILQRFENDMSAVGDGVAVEAGPLRVTFIRPPQAEQWLLRRATAEDIRGWLESWLPPMLHQADRVCAALVETTEEAKDRGQNDGLKDPKHVLRMSLGGLGVVSQFIQCAEQPVRRRADAPSDHAGVNAVSDLLRGAGYFLRPFPPSFEQPGAVVVGVYGAKLKGVTSGKDHETMVVNLVAVRTGTHEAYGYVDRKGWLPLGVATAAFLAVDQAHRLDDAKAIVERGVGNLRAKFRKEPLAVLFNAVGCRGRWPCLADKSDGVPEPWMTSEGKAVLRVRSEPDEVMRPAGAGLWDKAGSQARYTDFRAMRIIDADASALYVLSGSAVMSRCSSARSTTRFTASDKARADNWHALSATEILTLDSGPWARESLESDIAMLCRAVPMWNRVLRLPSPLHLARAAILDHPHRYGDAES